MDLPKIHSISKKILVALVGAFLLIFLLFHATANLFVLRHDGGAWYSAFCHFMGSNYLVKIVEILLLLIFAAHICLTLWLTLTNRMARPVRYHQRQRSKTGANSKLMMWTGILIFAFLVMHFCQFYFVKLGWVEGDYMVASDNLQKIEVMQEMNNAPEEDAMAVAELFNRPDLFETSTADGKYLRGFNYEDRQLMRRVAPSLDPEPDFYFMVRDLFHNPWMVLLYLITFVALFMHMSHAFPSAFQTLGLANYKYARAIDICGWAYAVLICLMFAVVPVAVFLGC